ncbi:MAG: gliding motility-associated C-terminal domain-containing protein [Flavobacteriales bacterium]|nr:gliding motility-associated C-terminal domain-containing protein [Flavobacteriales bacterium]
MLHTRIMAMAMVTLLAALPARSQTVTLTPAQYDQMKAAGTLPASFTVDRPMQRPIRPSVQQAPIGRHIGVPKGGGVNGDCNCWIEPDSSYLSAMSPNDDLSSAAIIIPFQFNLYGDQYNTLYINNNGNISFQNPYGTFSATPFPNNQFIMVAPFWADVDTRGDDGLGLNGGEVLYKVTPTALYVNWVDVGYFAQQTDKKNSFQLIITDGTDPVIGVGKNVSFCYKNMDWTTGSASGGVNGFGGTPAVVGANRGNAVDYIQFGTFDAPGSAYDGPFGAADGIDWLDNQNFVFTTSVSTQNIPPIASSTFLCDTVKVCTGQLVDIEMNFLAPEQNQTIVASSTATTLPGYSEVVNTSGGTNVLVQGQFTPTVADQGLHTITFTATDNGTPPLTTTIDIVVDVFYTTLPPPVITGDTVVCSNLGAVLTVPPLYDSYVWSNGYNGNSVLVSAGTYSVEVTAGYCTFGSNTVTVTEVPPPAPTITGVLFNCGGAPTVLGVDSGYVSYAWSNGETGATTTVSTGTYTVTVTDAEGCTGTSAPVNVLTAPAPDAFFTGSPSGAVFPGTAVLYTDGSNPNGAVITAWDWSLAGTLQGSGTTYATAFAQPGVYPVTLTVTTADGCTDSYTYDQLVKPTEIFVPNVFSPNGDGLNDRLEFTGLEYYPNAELSVFNRWGNEIYSSANYKNTWQANGVSDGTYYYVLYVDGKEYAGAVTLLR